MAYTAPTDDIIVQEGTFAYSFKCSGTIYPGQAVYPVATMEVKAVSANYEPGCIGVAAYKKTDDGYIGVYGPGNIVRVIVSGTAVAVSDRLLPVNEGKWKEGTGAHSSGCQAIALETQATDNGTCRVLLI